MMYEPICYDPDWERYMADPIPKTEDEMWDMIAERQQEAESESLRYAESMADMYDFEDDRERDAYIADKFMERMKELNCTW